MERPQEHRQKIVTSADLNSIRQRLATQRLLRSSGKQEDIESEEGNLNGALYCLYWPPGPLKGLVLHCHGCRPVGMRLLFPSIIDDRDSAARNDPEQA